MVFRPSNDKEVEILHSCTFLRETRITEIHLGIKCFIVRYDYDDIFYIKHKESKEISLEKNYTVLRKIKFLSLKII